MNDTTDYRTDPEKRSPTIDVTSKDIDGISDLVVWAPIKEGFIDAFNNVTYESRLRLVSEALHSLRKTAREFEKLEPFADTAKRIISLLDFRIGIVDRDMMGVTHDPSNGTPRSFSQRKYMYLVATFDGPLEPYMRLIYDPLGTFLDLVLCNCDGYKPALKNDFETYIKWVRDNQLDSAIFYSTSGKTVGDLIFLEEAEHIQRMTVDSFNKISRLTLTTPDEAADKVQQGTSTWKTARNLGLEALNVLYKLTDLYPPKSADGIYLLSATRDLLKGLESLIFKPADEEFGEPKERLDFSLQSLDENGGALKQPIQWFYSFNPAEKDRGELLKTKPAEIQKGLLSSYDEEDADGFWTTHGAILFAQIMDVEAFRHFIAQTGGFSWESDQPIEIPGTGISFYLNIAFSPHGLEKAGVPEEEMSYFSKEFREGASSRATLLGDKYDNHPRNWKLPDRNWLTDDSSDLPPIEPSEVHFILKIRTEIRSGLGVIRQGERVNEYFDFSTDLNKFVDLLEDIPGISTDNSDGRGFVEDASGLDLSDLEGDSIFRLMLAFFEIRARSSGFSILGVQSMSRKEVKQSQLTTGNGALSRTQNEDHFGFEDGLSQPIINQNDVFLPPDKNSHPMEVLTGDILYGYANTRHDQHRPHHKKRLALNGSYLVIRKISQNVEAFLGLEEQLGNLNPSLSSSLLVGRKKDGEPLVDPSDSKNEFRYDQDTEGEQCPLSAHIRLANPRHHSHGRRDPKILRRGMSYGTKYTEDSKHQDRGVVFMAYCASIAEQYEVIQRWLNGGNSTGVNTMRNDPLTGALERSENGTHTFVINRQESDSCRVRFDTPLTTLQWMDYFFVPSRTALSRIANIKTDSEFVKQKKCQSDARLNEGLRVLAELEPQHTPRSVRQQRWKAIIEDFLTKDPTEHDVTPKVWEAIDSKGGVYRIDDGIAFDENNNGSGQGVILVTNAELIAKVLSTNAQYPKGPYSCAEQKKRINEGFGTIYVCLDGDKTYYKEASDTNATLMKHGPECAFRTGYNAATETLADLQDKIAGKDGKFKVELSRQFIQPAIARLCDDWYGIPDGTHILDGPWNWATPGTERSSSLCPGDFLSPSRHTFYPRPTSTIADFGRVHGKHLAVKARAYVDAIWKNTQIKGYIAQDIFDEMKGKAKKNPGRTDYYKDLMVRNMIGGMVGAIPPMDGCLRWALFDWLREGSLWSYQSQYVRSKDNNEPLSDHNIELALNVVQKGLRTAMCVRPAPDLLYRTVVKSGHSIGNEKAKKGDLIILCLSAATQKALSEGNNDVSLVFGGNRKRPDGTQNPDSGLHSCPAKDLAMGAMTGMLTGLLNYGTIKEMPASLIIEMIPD